MNSRQELVSHLHQYLHCESFRDSCHNGLQVEGKEQIARVVTAVSASMETIEMAVQHRADALIVHHGLFWERSPVKNITGMLRKKLELLLQHQISLLAYHLPLDAHPDVGNNYLAAKQLGVRELQPFCEHNGMKIGVKGVIEPTAAEVWLERVEAYYGQKARAALFGPSLITTVGLVSGGADRGQLEAIQAGLDVYNTGTGDEPNWHLAKENRQHFLALGHAATERIGVRALAQYLQDHLGVEAQFIPDSNPY